MFLEIWRQNDKVATRDTVRLGPRIGTQRRRAGTACLDVPLGWEKSSMRSELGYSRRGFLLVPGRY